jgi:kinesin family protein 4/21/27
MSDLDSLSPHDKKSNLASLASTSTLSSSSKGSTSKSDGKNISGAPAPVPAPAIDCNVRVVVRTRPMLTLEKKRNCSNILQHNVAGRSISIKGSERGARSFTYDGVIPSRVSQAETYKITALTMLDSYFQGYNQTVMAYGQTGSGKTYTMGTAADDSNSCIDQDSGILPRFIVDAFERIDKLKQGSKQITTTVSFLEVHNEQLKDLLSSQDEHSGIGINNRHGNSKLSNNHSRGLTIMEGKNGNKSIRVVGLREVKVSSVSDVLDALARGTRARTTAATLMNETSSRSHAVFTLTTTQKPKIAVMHADEEAAGGNSTVGEVDNQAMVSKATFVDLAGSERINRTGAVGKRKEEGISINEGLLSLGRVINALADEEALKKGIKSHVPYRNSKLTRLLQDALGGNSRTLFIACVSPADDNCEETLGTLRYAHQARNIKNAAVLNVDPRAALLGRLQRERQAFMHQALIYRFSEFEMPLEDLLKRNDVQNYIASIVEQINPDVTVTSSWENINDNRRNSISNSGAYNGHKTSLSGSNDKTGDCGAPQMRPSSSPGKHRKTFSAPILPPPHGSPTSFPGGKQNEMSSDDTPAHESVKKAKLTPSQKQVMDALDNDEIESLLNSHENSILEQELEVEKRDRAQALESEAHNEQVDSLRVQISTKEDLLRTIKDSLTHYNKLKEKEKEHAQQLRESEAERVRLEKQLNHKQRSKNSNRGKPVSTAARRQLEKKYKDVVDRLKSLKSQHQRQKFLLRNLEREAARAAELERGISVLKAEKVSLARARKRETATHRQWKIQKEKELRKLRRDALKQKREMQRISTDRERQRVRLERRGDQLQHAAARLRETRMELMTLLQKKNKVSRRRNANMRLMGSSRSKKSTQAAKEARAQKLEEAAQQNFREHAVNSKLILLQQEIMRTAAIQSKEGELEQQLEKRATLLSQLTNLVGARQQLAEEGLGDITNGDGSTPPSKQEYEDLLAIELSNIDSKIEACEMKIAAVTGTIQECTSELKILNSERKGHNEVGFKKPSGSEKETGINPLVQRVLDKQTSNSEGQYMMSQLVELACELQCANSNSKKALKLAEAQNMDTDKKLKKQMKLFQRMQRQWEVSNARVVRDYEKDILAIVKHGVADSVFSEQASLNGTRNDQTPNKKTGSSKASMSLTPLQRDRKYKVAHLLREKISELEALSKERTQLKSEVSHLNEKCDRLEKVLQLARVSDNKNVFVSNGDDINKGGTLSEPRKKSISTQLQNRKDLHSENHMMSTSSRIALLTQKWKELGVDKETQEKFMVDLRMSVDERADKYIEHLTDKFSEHQNSIAKLETELTKHMAILGEMYSTTATLGAGTGMSADVSVLVKKHKLEEHLATIKTRIDKQKARYTELRTRATELCDELDLKEDEVGEELDSLLSSVMPTTFSYKNMVSLEAVVRALIVTKSKRLVTVQQKCRRLRKTLDMLGLTPMECLPCYENFAKACLSDCKDKIDEAQPAQAISEMHELCTVLNQEDFTMSRLSLDRKTIRKLTQLNMTMENVKAHRVGSIKVLCSILTDVKVHKASAASFFVYLHVT